MEMFELNKNTMLNNNKTSSRRTSASMGMVPTTKDLILIVLVALLITAGKYERYNDQGLLKVGAYLENCWSTLYILCILQECHATAPGNLSMKNFLKNFMSNAFAVPPPKAQKLVLILVIITQHAVPFTVIIIMKLI